MQVYAIADGTIIWSSVRANHKQGRVVAGCPLVVMNRSGTWYEIEEPELDREVKPEYGNFWVRVEDTVLGVPPVDPPVEGVSDMDAAVAILTLLQYMKQ